MVQRGVDALLAGRALAEGEGLVIGFVHFALGGQGGEEAVLAGAEGRVDSRGAAFGADVVVIVFDDVGEGADFRVGEGGEVGRDIVVEIDCDVGEWRPEAPKWIDED